MQHKHYLDGSMETYDYARTLRHPIAGMVNRLTGQANQVTEYGSEYDQKGQGVKRDRLWLY